MARCLPWATAAPYCATATERFATRRCVWYFRTRMSGTSSYNATIEDRRVLRDGLFVVRIAPDEGSYPPFLAGQHVQVGRNLTGKPADALDTRTFSISSSVRRRRSLEMFVSVAGNDAFAEWLGNADIGSALWLAPRAEGTLTLDRFEKGKDLVLVATGTGIAPFVSMYRTHHESPPWRRLTIVHGARTALDLGYRGELERAARGDDRFTYVPTVSREPEPSGWPGLRGRVTLCLEGADAAQTLDPANTHVYLCGNREMVDDLARRLTKRGFQAPQGGRPGNLHFEKYW